LATLKFTSNLIQTQLSRALIVARNLKALPSLREARKPRRGNLDKTLANS